MQGIVLHGNTDPYIIEEAFLAQLGRSPTAAELDSVMSAYLRHLEAELLPEGSVRRMPQVEETITALVARGATIGLATGNIEAGARLKLERVGLWHHFPFGGFGSDAGSGPNSSAWPLPAPGTARASPLLQMPSG